MLIGPFKIKQKIRQSSYELELPASWKALHSTFNESLLMPYEKPQYKAQKKPKPLPPDLIEGEKEYKVEKIEKRKRNTVPNQVERLHIRGRLVGTS